jgi:protein-tyrosine phosphatase
MKKVLFVCKHNRARSKIAEVIFNKLAEERGIDARAESAGLLLDEKLPFVAESVIKLMAEKGYKIGGKPMQLTFRMLDNFDTIVIISEGFDEKMFDNFKGKIFIWKIKDASSSDLTGIRKIIDEIEKDVKKFLDEID